MFFVLSKLLVSLIYPLSIACLLLVGAWWAWSRRPPLGRDLGIAALALLWLPSTTPVADLLLLPLEMRYPVVVDPPHAQAVVVLTGMLDTKAARGDQIEMGEAGDRILAGVALLRSGHADYLVISGGSGDLFDQSTSEAPILGRLATQLGVPAEQILVERTSRNTYENAVETQALLAERGLSKKVILVTSAFHMPRALGCFWRMGLDPLPYPVDFRNRWGAYNPLSLVPSAPNLVRSSMAIREYVGLAMYWLQGYLTSAPAPSSP